MMVKSCNSGSSFLDEYPILLPSTMMDVDNGTRSLGQPPIRSYPNNPQIGSSTSTEQNAAAREGNTTESFPFFSTSTYQPSVIEQQKVSYNAHDLNQFSILSALSEAHYVPKPQIQNPLNQMGAIEGQAICLPPTVVDVVCSRGKRYFRHPGNQRFRQIIQESVQEYIDAETRMDKSIVIDSIIESVRAQDNSRLVRFMKHQSRSNSWTELPLEQIRDKVSHALRDAVNGLDRKKVPGH